MSNISSAASPRVSPRRAWLSLIAMIPAVLVVGLDVTVLSVALPTLSRSLSATTEELQWIVMAYTLTFASGIIAFGLLGDRFGRRSVLAGALAVFAAGSLWCALSTTAASLIGARALLGVGAAGIATLSVAIVNVLFDEERRATAITSIMFVNVIGFPLGPIFGGWLLQHVRWGWIFFVNVPVAVIALVSVMLFMPENRSATAPHWDPLGLASATGAVIAWCFGLTKAGSAAWSTPVVWLPLVAGALLVAGFLIVEHTSSHPAVPLALFSRPAFAGGAATATALSFVIAGLLFVVPQYTAAILGADTLKSGLYLLPFAVGMVLTMPITTMLVRRLGSAATIAVGLALLTVALGIAMLTVHRQDGSWLLIWATLVGAAFGLVLSTAMDLAIGAVEVESSGIGSAVLQSLRQIGTAFGIALLGSLLASGYRNALPDDLPPGTARTVRGGVEQGLAVAQHLDLAELTHQVRDAFLDGTNLVWITCLSVSAVATLAAAASAIRARRSQPWS